MTNGLEERLAVAGDEYISYFQLLEQAAELKRIADMLDERAGWTACTNGVEARPAERVDALLNFVAMRSVA
jgi:hypothetical protein